MLFFVKVKRVKLLHLKMINVLSFIKSFKNKAKSMYILPVLKNLGRKLGLLSYYSGLIKIRRKTKKRKREMTMSEFIVFY